MNEDADGLPRRDDEDPGETDDEHLAHVRVRNEFFNGEHIPVHERPDSRMSEYIYAACKRTQEIDANTIGQLAHHVEQRIAKIETTAIREAFVQGFIAAKEPRSARDTLVLLADAERAYEDWRRTRTTAP